MAFLRFPSLALAASLIAAVTHAAPAPHAAIKARDIVTEVVTETSWTTVDFTTTIYLDDLPPTPTPAPSSVDGLVDEAAEEIQDEVVDEGMQATDDVAAEMSPSTVDAEGIDPPKSEESVQEPTPAVEDAEDDSPQESEQPAPDPYPVIDTVEDDSSQESEEPASDPAPVTDTTDPESSSGGSESADCTSSSSSCKGDVTYWDGGLGACGEVVNTESDNAIALPHGFMGTQSNDNPYCGKTVTVINPETGTTVKGTIMDKCMSCPGRHIDLTSKMFKEVTDGVGDGREPNFEWYID